MRLHDLIMMINKAMIDNSRYLWIFKAFIDPTTVYILAVLALMKNDFEFICVRACTWE